MLGSGLAFTGNDIQCRMRCGTETNNCVPSQQLVSNRVTRPVLSLRRVWLARLLSGCLRSPSVILATNFGHLVNHILACHHTHISTLCTYHCVYWGNILHLHIRPMECEYKGWEQPHHWLPGGVSCSLRSCILIWDTGGCKRCLMHDSGGPHSLHWV